MNDGGRRNQSGPLLFWELAVEGPTLDQKAVSMVEIFMCLMGLAVLASILEGLTGKGRKAASSVRRSTKSRSSSPMDDVYKDPIGVALDNDHPAQIAAQVLVLDVMEPGWEDEIFRDG